MLFNNIAINNQTHRLSASNNKMTDFNNFFQIKDDSYFSKQNSKIVSFKAITKLQKFDILANSEKRDIQNIAKRLFKDKNALLTLLDKKPSALVVISEDDFKTINKHKKLFESENIRFVIQDKTAKNHNKNKRNIYVVNTVEFKNVLENNIDFLRYRLNEPDLNVDKAFTVLTSKDSPLFDIKNYHDLIGICLGFPSQDSMMFNLRRDIANLLKDFEVRGRDSSNAFKTLDLLYSILQPPQSQALLLKFNS